MSNTILQNIPVGQKVGIAFSGGLDTSAALLVDEAKGRPALRLHRQPGPARRERTTTKSRARPWNTAPIKARLVDCRHQLAAEGIAALQSGAFHITTAGVTYFNTTPLGRAVTGTMLVMRHEAGRRQHLGRRLHLQGQRHRALLPLRPVDQPALKIYKPWLDQTFIDELGGRAEMSAFIDRQRLWLQDERRKGLLAPTATCWAPPTKPKTWSS